MDNSTLNKATMLKKSIEDVKEQIEFWKTPEENMLCIQLTSKAQYGFGRKPVDLSYSDFESMREYKLKQLNEANVILEEQFRNL